MLAISILKLIRLGYKILRGKINMNLELCDLCRKKEPNKRFKIKMSAKGYYRKTEYGT